MFDMFNAMPDLEELRMSEGDFRGIPKGYQRRRRHPRSQALPRLHSGYWMSKGTIHVGRTCEQMAEG